MIQPESLRIGNYVHCYNLEFQILTVNQGYVTHPNEQGLFHLRDCEPIPLTEECLIKFDLKKREVLTSPESYNEYSIRNEFEIYCHMDKSGNCLFWGGCLQGEDFFIIKCDTVHGFQNIFKVLTSKELTIKA